MKGSGSALTDSNLFFARRSETLLSLALLAVLVVLLVPLPPPLLDMLLALNLAITILLLLITVGVTQPLDISVFPSLLLLMTLYRLSLNVATTRLILLDGNAGRIVSTFGGFVVGGNLVVGLVIFLILIVIQFIVITKGAGRVSEVAARFTLDAMPGKQMAVDAELSSGSIDETEARKRREHLTRESEFYGAMDGASKFVRGDAIAGLVITAINLVGGVILGVMQGVTVAEAVRRYSILTIGDGLVSQIPALIIATTAGIVVTKATTNSSLGQEIGTQVLAKRRPLVIGAVILAVMAMTPGLPKIPFLLLSAALLIFVRRLHQKALNSQRPTAEDGAALRSNQDEPLEDFLQTDRLTLEIGARLIPMVDTRRSKGLTERIASLRRDMTKKHGIWVPFIRIRDNIRLDPESYRVLVGGREVARGKLRLERYLAIESGQTRLDIEGEETKDPAFGLPAKWISGNDRQRAELGGFTVVDAASVLMTHLGEVLRRYAHELLSREDLQKLLDKTRETAPTTVEEIRSEVLRIGTLHQVLVLLLEEKVPITNFTKILETVAKHAPQVKEPQELAEKVRAELGRDICDRFKDAEGRVRLVVTDPRLEMTLRQSLRDKNLALPPGQLEKLVASLSQQWQKCGLDGREVALLTDSNLRRPVRKAIERALPDMAVIAYCEIPSDLLIEPVAMLRADDVVATASLDIEKVGSSPSDDTVVNEILSGLNAA